MPHSDTQAFLRKPLKWDGRLVRPSKITSTGKLIDDALEWVEKENPNGAERHGLPRRAARRVRDGAQINRKNVPIVSVYDRRTLKSPWAARQPNDSRQSHRRTNSRETSDARRPALQLKIAASCFSIYAIEPPKMDLVQIHSREFIFMSPNGSLRHPFASRGNRSPTSARHFRLHLISLPCITNSSAATSHWCHERGNS